MTTIFVCTTISSMSKNYHLGCVKCAGSTPTSDTAETCSNRAVDEFLLTLGCSLNKILSDTRKLAFLECRDSLVSVIYYHKYRSDEQLFRLIFN